MQYETVILELLTRIKKLEEEVMELKEIQNIILFGYQADNSNCIEEGVQKDSVVPYKKMTEEMIQICYKYGKRVYNGENAQKLADDIASETGMNRNSAFMYLYVVSAMLEGSIYKRAISAKAMKIFFENILNEFGTMGLKKAIEATKLHIDYRIRLGHTVDSIEEVCNTYENRL